MNQLLNQLTGSQGRFIEQMWAGLELATGQTGHDVNLIGQILTATNRKLRQLGFESGLVLADELQLVLRHRFAELERRFEQAYPTADSLSCRLTDLLRATMVLELSSVAQERLDFRQVAWPEQVANLQFGYFQANPVRVVLTGPSVDQRLTTEVQLVPSLTRLKSCLLTILAVERRVRQSNQLALILASQARPDKLLFWLKHVATWNWTLAGFPVVNQTIESILADADSIPNQQLHQMNPDLAARLTFFDPQILTNQLINDQIFADSYNLGLTGERLVSINLFDQILNNNQQLYATVYYQLISKYLQNSGLSQQILNQLDKKILT